MPRFKTLTFVHVPRVCGRECPRNDGILAVHGASVGSTRYASVYKHGWKRPPSTVWHIHPQRIADAPPCPCTRETSEACERKSRTRKEAVRMRGTVMPRHASKWDLPPRAPNM
eukprot:scaffold653_cov345-Pavlova_lutheri.AAC.13